MAKSGAIVVSDAEVTEKGSNSSDRAKELKKELLRLAMEIISDNLDEDDEDDKGGDNGVILTTIHTAIQALSTLKELKSKKRKSSPSSSGIDKLNVPDKFRCPISGEIMRDPVVLANGQTYDRVFIEKWLKEGHRTCPKTEQVLSHTVLTPNNLVRELISQWSKDHGIEIPSPVKDIDDAIMADADRDRLNVLLDKMMSSSLSDQKQAAKEIRLLTKRLPSFRSFFGESNDAIPQLLNPLTLPGELDDHSDLQEDLITTVLNLSLHDSNKKYIAEHPLVIPLLVGSLKRGSHETRTNAAAALFSLSALDSNKHLIGQSGALKPLIELLEEGNPLSMKDSASAIFNLCIVVENRGRAVGDGAIKVILQKIRDHVLVDEMLTILALLSSHHRAVDVLGDLGAVECLLSIMRESTCERNQENCIAILHAICLYNRSKLKEVREEEKANGTISKLAENGTSRAKRKATSILERLNRGIYLTHTA